MRDWHGVGHTVTVLDDGFDYDDRRWTSLTAIARSITGAKWSGPRFFGLNAAGGRNGSYQIPLRITHVPMIADRWT